MDLPVERCDRTGDIHTGGYPDILGNREERYSRSGLEGYSYLGTLFSSKTWSPGDSSWTTVSPLHRTVGYTESVSLNNRIYLFGKIIKQIVQ